MTKAKRMRLSEPTDAVMHSIDTLYRARLESSDRSYSGHTVGRAWTALTGDLRTLAERCGWKPAAAACLDLIVELLPQFKSFHPGNRSFERSLRRLGRAISEGASDYRIPFLKPYRSPGTRDLAAAITELGTLVKETAAPRCWFDVGEWLSSCLVSVHSARWESTCLGSRHRETINRAVRARRRKSRRVVESWTNESANLERDVLVSFLTHFQKHLGD
jgi:hypothetical protein